MFLNTHSCFSLKYGIMHIEDLLAEAQRKGISSFALTDINNTSGCLDFVRLATKYGVKPVVGIDFRHGTQQQYIGIAQNNEGFRELNEHLTERLSLKIVPIEPPFFNYAYVIYPYGTKDYRKLQENEYIGIRMGDFNKLIFSGWKCFLNKFVILHPVTFRDKKDFNAHRLLRAIDNNTLLSKLPVAEQALENEIMFTTAELYKLYEDYLEVLKNTESLLADCCIEFEFGKSKNKKTFTGDAFRDIDLLRELCYDGLKYRYDIIDDIVIERVEKELKMINELGFCSYFLINWDIVRYAQHRGFFYVGRGSGANSVVAYALRITDVDPIDLDLYFERFINQYRANPPDFDIDFSWKDRDEIIDYIFRTHGRRHTSLLATYNTFQSRSVIRELGKVFGLPKGEIDNLVAQWKVFPQNDHIAKLIYIYSQHIHELPSHLSIHAGGVLISEKPITCYTALSAPPKGFPLTQFSMLEAEDIGLYKFDILSQRGLGHIRDTVSIVKKNKGIDIDAHDIKAFKEDPKIKEHLRKGKTIGCFYVESPAMRMLLKKLEADTYLALVAASSIIRPGVAQSGMMREYILRFRYPERRKYSHPKMEELMQETYGIMVYQEDVIKVAHFFAGLSLAESDVLRRGMSGKFRSREEFQRAKDRFFECCKARGYADVLTAEVWRQIESFAGYSFSKGHSASYAVESYQSLYLKAHYPKEFMVGVINNFGGFYRTEIYVHEAKMCGANVLPPCVNASEYLTSIIGDDIYLGFVHMGEFEQKCAAGIINERSKNGCYKSLSDFMMRVAISLEQLRLLIRVGAFRFTGRTKKELLWDIHAIMGASKKTNPNKDLFEVAVKTFQLPPLHHTEHDDALDEIEILGFPLNSAFQLLKENPENIILAKDLMQHIGEIVSLVGYLVCTKPTRTIRDEYMSFGTFIDSEGDFIDTTHFPKPLAQYPFRGRGCYLIQGKAVEEFNFPSIEVTSMEKLSVSG